MQLRVLFSNQVISMGCNQVVNISGKFFMSFCISSMACILNQSGRNHFKDLHPCGVMEAFHCSLTKKDVNFVFDWMTNGKDSQLKCTF
ncbi:hypothetical protein AB3S75_044425 [Citrus x aurantiifolia]